MKYLPILIFTLFLLSGCGGTNESENGNQSHILTIKLEPLVKSQNYNLEGNFIGRVEANRSSRLGFDLGGELKEVLVNEGETIKRGQPVAVLNSERLSAAKNQASAQIKQAKTQLKLTKATLNRNREAFKFQGVSNQQLEQSQQAFDSSKAAVASAKAQLKRIDVDIKQSTIKAPYDAVVIVRHVNEGEIMSPSQPVIDIEETSNRKIRIGVSSNIIDKLVIDSNYELDIEGVNTPTTLKAIVPTRDQITKTIDLIFVLNTTDNQPSTGSIARFSYDKKVDQQGFWVPIGVLTEANRGLWTVLIAIENDTESDGKPNYMLQQRVVDIVHQQGERVYVKGALKQGDLFVAAGIHRVVPGQTIYAQSN